MQELGLRARRDKDVEASLQTMMRYWRAWIERIVQQGQAEGTFRRQLDPDQAVSMLLAVLSGSSYVGVQAVENIQRATEEWLLAPEVKEELKGEKP
jgi:hypothetical protein